ncbi:hypothetical protein BE17_26995, partial [Sorangium cellulosum]
PSTWPSSCRAAGEEIEASSAASPRVGAGAEVEAHVGELGGYGRPRSNSATSRRTPLDLAIALTYTAPEQIAGCGVEEHRGGVRSFRRTEGSGS